MLNRNELFEKMLTDTLRIFMSYDESTIEELLQNPHLIVKEQVAKIFDLNVIIHSNDHNPPHFHVISNDYKINAKFSIKTGEFLMGEIDSKNIKRIKAFYISPKGKIIMEKVWNKRL